MKKRPETSEVFIPLGFTFMATGVVFMSTVNKGVGIGLLALGISWLVIGLKIKSNNKGKDE